MSLQYYEQFINTVTFESLGLKESKNIFPVCLFQKRCPMWDPEKCRECKGLGVFREPELLIYIKNALYGDLFGMSQESEKFLSCFMKNQYRVCILIQPNRVSLFYMEGNSKNLFGKNMEVDWQNPDDIEKVKKLLASDFPQDSTRYFLMVEDTHEENEGDKYAVRGISNTFAGSVRS